MQSIELKIKINSLAAEARIIRYYEDKLSWDAARADSLDHHYPGGIGVKQAFLMQEYGMTEKQATRSIAQFERSRTKARSLRRHRTMDVRRESRDTCLAIGFLKGRSYKQMEPISYTQPRWGKVEAMVIRHAGMDARVVKQRFEQWVQEGRGKLNIERGATFVAPMLDTQL
jgi:hypothetical protein